MAALLSVHHLPIVLSIHGERPSMTGLAYHNSDIRLPTPIGSPFGEDMAKQLFVAT